MLQTKTIISTLAALNDKLTCTLTVLYITFLLMENVRLTEMEG